MKPSNNKELYDYLIHLAAKLNEAGAPQIAECVLAASRTAWTIPVTEFLGESRIALRRVLEMDVGILNSRERFDLQDVLSEIDNAFDRHGRQH
jgi:hypothetical protein